LKLATLRDGSRDGRLLVVSSDLKRAVSAETIAPNLQWALDHWSACEPRLRELSQAVAAGRAAGAFDFDASACMAPLPRAAQWLDGSDFPNHGQWVCAALGIPPLSTAVPLMYQGGSDDLLGGHEDMPLPDESHDIDIEGEIAAVLGEVPMGTRRGQALDHVRLLMLANDCSLRALQVREMQSGFGMMQTKPSTSFSPVAVTPDELAPWWREGRLHRRLAVHINGRPVGSPDGGLMKNGFAVLIEHAARTRRLRAGTLIGSGTVSDPQPSAGSAAIAEIRALEQHRIGRIDTPYLRFGDRVKMEMFDDSGHSLFGAIDHAIVKAVGA
jgi:fumarylacetoacetate (FAA) hydrolase